MLWSLARGTIHDAEDSQSACARSHIAGEVDGPLLIGRGEHRPGPQDTRQPLAARPANAQPEIALHAPHTRGWLSRGRMGSPKLAESGPPKENMEIIGWVICSKPPLSEVIVSPSNRATVHGSRTLGP